jgi:hypothetical protein
MQFKLAIAGAFALFIGPQVLAVETVHGSRAAFEDMLGASVTDSYSNPGYVFVQNDAAMSAVLGETDYVSTGFNNLNIVLGGRYCAGCNGSFRLIFTSTSVTEGNGVFGVGLDIVSNSGYSALVSFGDGGTQLYALPGSGNFWGITSTRQVSQIDFGPGGNPSTSGYFQIDNLTIGAVPEPQTWALLIVGFGMIGAAARQRRLAAA